MKNQSGFGQIEALIALSILGLVGTSLLGGLLTITKVTPIADERSTAQTLAESQLEYVRTQDYDYINDPPEYLDLSVVDVPFGYTISTTATRLDHDNDGAGDDDGIQKITVTIDHHNETVTTLESYRIRR